MAGMALRPETEEQGKLRFQLELEFVQCLANPNYLNFLAQRGYLKEQVFVNYIQYLQYWKQPEYAKFLKYPMTLYFLDLLQYPEFRKEISNSKCAKFVEDQQLLHWQHYIRKRSKLVPSAQTPQAGGSVTENVPGSSAPAPPPIPNSNNITGGFVTTPGLSSIASTVSSSASGPSPAQNFSGGSSSTNPNTFTNK